jgi:hypothetical protein
VKGLQSDERSIFVCQTTALKLSCKKTLFSPKISPPDIVKAHPPSEQKVLMLSLDQFYRSGSL